MKMNKNFFWALTIIFMMSASLSAQQYQDQLPPKEKWSLTVMQGKVVDIMKETRELTVIGPEGNMLTITAGDGVKRFEEIAVDDVIEFDYWEYISAEFRWPTPEELAEPLLVLAEADKAPEGMDPGVAIGALVRAVVTIEVINRPYMQVTVKGPKGNYMTFDIEDKLLIQQVNVGQIVIITYAEAMALSLIKINPDK
jgi:hypothetical protein